MIHKNFGTVNDKTGAYINSATGERLNADTLQLLKDKVSELKALINTQLSTSATDINLMFNNFINNMNSSSTKVNTDMQQFKVSTDDLNTIKTIIDVYINNTLKPFYTNVGANKIEGVTVDVLISGLETRLDTLVTSLSSSLRADGDVSLSDWDKYVLSYFDTTDGSKGKRIQYEDFLTTEVPRLLSSELLSGEDRPVASKVESMQTLNTSKIASMKDTISNGDDSIDGSSDFSMKKMEADVANYIGVTNGLSLDRFNDEGILSNDSLSKQLEDIKTNISSLVQSYINIISKLDDDILPQRESHLKNRLDNIVTTIRRNLNRVYEDGLLSADVNRSLQKKPIMDTLSSNVTAEINNCLSRGFNVGDKALGKMGYLYDKI